MPILDPSGGRGSVLSSVHRLGIVTRRPRRLKTVIFDLVDVLHPHLHRQRRGLVSASFLRASGQQRTDAGDLPGKPRIASFHPGGVEGPKIDAVIVVVVEITTAV